MYSLSSVIIRECVRLVFLHVHLSNNKSRWIFRGNIVISDFYYLSIVDTIYKTLIPQLLISDLNIL